MGSCLQLMICGQPSKQPTNTVANLPSALASAASKADMMLNNRSAVNSNTSSRLQYEASTGMLSNSKVASKVTIY